MKKELLVVALCIAAVLLSLPLLDHHVKPWLAPVVNEGELEAAKWIKTQPAGLVACDIFGCELVMGIAGRSGLVGGDWAANPDSPAQMSAMHEFYQTGSADKAVEIMRKYNASYAWFPSRQVFAGYGWIAPNEEKMSDVRFSLAYNATGVRVYSLSGT